jgi:hypothetical protein
VNNLGPAAGTVLNPVERLFAEATDAQKVTFQILRTTSSEIRSLCLHDRTPTLITTLRKSGAKDISIRRLFLSVHGLIQEGERAYAARKDDRFPGECRALAKDIRALANRLRKLPGMQSISALDQFVVQMAADHDDAYSTRLQSTFDDEVLDDRHRNLCVGKSTSGRHCIRLDSEELNGRAPLEVPTLLELFDGFAQVLNMSIGSRLMQDDRTARFEAKNEPGFDAQKPSQSAYVRGYVSMSCDELINPVIKVFRSEASRLLSRIILG